jgi:hypothetical protein
VSGDGLLPPGRGETTAAWSQLLSMDELPGKDAGHPSLHEQVGAAWTDWDKQRRAWRTLLAPRLLDVRR